jgi:uncharacterized membrane protein YcaP (DUF421 family)
MDAVFRASVMYLFLLIIFRITGKRTLGQSTTFDFVLLLIIGEATQQALLGNDFSLTNAVIVITTLVLIDVGIAFWKQRSQTMDKLLDGMPLVIVDNGEPLKERMDRVRIDEEDILSAARLTQGLERMEQIKYAVLERSGDISIIPTER